MGVAVHRLGSIPFVWLTQGHMVGGGRYGTCVGPCTLLAPVGAHLNECMCLHVHVQCVRVVVLGDVLHARAHEDMTGASHAHSAVTWHGQTHTHVMCV